MARRKRVEHAWIVLGLVWALARVWVAKATVEQYGVNIFIFAVIELAVAWPHSLSTARIVANLVDRHPDAALRWAVVLAVTHIGPELYIALAGSHMPAGIYWSLLAIVLILGVVAGIGIYQKVRVGRAAREGNHAATLAAREPLEREAFLAAVESLPFDRGNWAVFGSGPLLVNGIVSSISDVDVIAQGPAWTAACEYASSEASVGDSGDRMVRFASGDGATIEVFDGWLGDQSSVARWIAEADIIDGIRFVKVAEVLAFKKRLNRPKDAAHIAAIEKHARTAGKKEQ
jgi:hypothetical protein